MSSGIEAEAIRVRVYCCQNCESHGTVCEVTTEENTAPTRCPMNWIPSWRCDQ